jgi:hypothetical protein
VKPSPKLKKMKEAGTAQLHHPWMEMARYYLKATPFSHLSRKARNKRPNLKITANPTPTTLPNKLRRRWMVSGY